MFVSAGTSTRKASLILGGLGVVSLLFYLATSFLIPQSPKYMESARAMLIPRLPLWLDISELPLPVPNTAVAVVSILIATTIFTLASYFLALWISRRTIANRITLSIVLGFMILFFLTSVLSLPNSSSDLYAYIKSARVFNIYHANPYAVPPVVLPINDPYLQLHGQARSSTPYGPVWTFLSIAWQRLAGEDVVTNLLAFRGLLLGFSLANVALIWKILGRSNPAYALTGVLFYAWNPIVILDGPGHLDTVMAFFLLLSVYFYVTKREWLALVALTLSALTKFITAPLLVVYLLFLWRNKSFRSAAIGAGLVGALVILAFLPIWDGWEMFGRLLRQPHNLNPGSAFTSRRLIFGPGFLAVVLWASLRGRGTIGDMLKGWAVVMLWFSLFLMPTFYAWYLITLIAIVSLVDQGEIVAMTLTLCLTALLTNMLGGVAGPYISPSRWVFRFIWWGPPFLVLLWLYRTRLGEALLSARQYMRETRKSIHI